VTRDTVVIVKGEDLRGIAKVICARVHIGYDGRGLATATWNDRSRPCRTALDPADRRRQAVVMGGTREGSVDVKQWKASGDDARWRNWRRASAIESTAQGRR
jgi:hypothetical protein